MNRDNVLIMDDDKASIPASKVIFHQDVTPAILTKSNEFISKPMNTLTSFSTSIKTPLNEVNDQHCWGQLSPTKVSSNGTVIIPNKNPVVCCLDSSGTTSKVFCGSLPTIAIQQQHSSPNVSLTENTIVTDQMKTHVLHQQYEEQLRRRLTQEFLSELLIPQDIVPCKSSRHLSGGNPRHSCLQGNFVTDGAVHHAESLLIQNRYPNRAFNGGSTTDKILQLPISIKEQPKQNQPLLVMLEQNQSNSFDHTQANDANIWSRNIEGYCARGELKNRMIRNSCLEYYNSYVKCHIPQSTHAQFRGQLQGNFTSQCTPTIVNTCNWIENQTNLESILNIRQSETKERIEALQTETRKDVIDVRSSFSKLEAIEHPPIEQLKENFSSGKKRKHSSMSSVEHNKKHVPQIHSTKIDAPQLSPELAIRSDPLANEKPVFGYIPGRRLSLYIDSDAAKLSKFQCFLKQQIYLFEAGPYDLCCTAQGRNKPIVLGQVGIVCKYCSSTPPGLRPSASVYFPRTLAGLYQASQNMYKNHFMNTCPSTPVEVLNTLRSLKGPGRTQSSIVPKSTMNNGDLGGGKHNWAEAGKALGVVQVDDTLRFLP